MREHDVISGRRALLEILKQEGVEVIFGNPGTTELPLMDALAGETELRYVLVLQEAALMAMADGYGQASGRLSMVNLHVAPGLGNAMGMMFNALKANAPILVTAGTHDQSYSFTEPSLSADLPSVARPFVKWAAEARRFTDLPRAVHRAAKLAVTPPTGPVFLSLPVDVLNAEGPLDLGTPTRVGERLHGDPAQIATAATLLARAERPLIIAGNVISQTRAFAEVIALAETLGAPVYQEGEASTATFPASHPLYRGSYVRIPPVIRDLLSQHDLLFSMGGDLFTLLARPDVEPVPPGIRFIHLDNDPWEIGKNYPALGILGDPRATLPPITAALVQELGPAGQDRCRKRAAAVAAEIATDREALRARARAMAERTPLRPLPLLEAISRALPANAVVVEEALSSAGGIRQLLRSDDPQSYFGMRGGGVGWGLPAAIGVKLALPERPVLALIGDGSAMYTIQALWTAAHQRLGVVFMILNNGSYRILKQRAQALRGLAAQTGRYVGMDLSDPAVDFVGLAASLGVTGERVTTMPAALDALSRGLVANAPVLVEVVLNRELVD